METPTNTLDALSGQLEQLAASMTELNQRFARLRQDNIWDINMLRQEMATQQNLKNLGRGLASKQDLSQILDVVCQRIAALRFESHQEHRELRRFIDEWPGKWIVDCLPASQGTGWGRGAPRAHERSATLTTDRVLDIEEVGATLAPSSPRVTLMKVS